MLSELLALSVSVSGSVSVSTSVSVTMSVSELLSVECAQLRRHLLSSVLFSCF